MKNIIDMLDALRAKLNCPSDMALAKAMGISRQAVSQWRLGMGMSDAQAARIAELLGVDVILALLFGAASRSDGEPIRQHWLEAARLREYTLCVLSSPARRGLQPRPDWLQADLLTEGFAANPSTFKTLQHRCRFNNLEAARLCGVAPRH